MKVTAIGVFVLVAAGLGQALKCYECSSEESWDKCSVDGGSAEERNCLPNQDRCGKVETIFQRKTGRKEIRLFGRGCTTKAICDAKKAYGLEACKERGGSICESSCCTEDLCNAGSTNVFSTIIMLACGLVALF